MHALGCIVAILFGLFWFIGSAVYNIYRTAFGPFKSAGQKARQYDGQASQSGQQRRPGRKIFEDDEGEYVAFEEIKD